MTEDIDIKDKEGQNTLGSNIPIAGENNLMTQNETNNMEVHHHPQLHHKPKPWKEYFLEFLMIFLAVTLGFFAENIREYFSDKHKGKEYAESFKEDLIKDTAIFENTLLAIKKNITGGDSLVKYMQNGKVKNLKDLQNLYRFSLSSLGGFAFSNTDRTTTQLKNSGAMRFITNKEVANGIMNYWQDIDNLLRIGVALETMRYQAREKSYSIFDNKFYLDSSDSKGIRLISENPKLMTYNYSELAEFSNRVAHFKNLLKGAYTSILLREKKSAIDLIKKINKDYDL